MDEETIVALATPWGRGGIAVIRLSGSRSEEIVRRLVKPLPARLKARHSYHGFLHDGERRVDECLAVVFRAPLSYSGEDVAEISLHSNPFVVEEAVALACCCGARPALPGEFTYRAFRNGKMDLLQAEAVNDLIRANSRAGALMEFGNLEGRLSQAVAALRDALIGAAVEIETAIEFAEDQHVVPPGDSALSAAASSLERILASGRFGEILNRGLQVVIAGRVNVGKSSLFNAMLMKERSIISALPGTTRDYIEETLLLDGFAFRVSDVAGIRSQSGDDIEEQGMRRSLEKIAAADAVLFMIDASQPLQEDDREIYRLLAGRKHILLANKSDVADAKVVAAIRSAFPAETINLISAKTGEKLDLVSDFLRSLLRAIPVDNEAAAVNLPQRNLLENLRESIGKAMNLQPEMAAEEIRRGLRIIGELTGSVGVDEILHGVFARFCIGK